MRFFTDGPVGLYQFLSMTCRGLVEKAGAFGVEDVSRPRNVEVSERRSYGCVGRRENAGRFLQSLQGTCTHRVARASRQTDRREFRRAPRGCVRRQGSRKGEQGLFHLSFRRRQPDGCRSNGFGAIALLPGTWRRVSRGQLMPIATKVRSRTGSSRGWPGCKGSARNS